MKEKYLGTRFHFYIIKMNAIIQKNRRQDSAAYMVVKILLTFVHVTSIRGLHMLFL